VSRDGPKERKSERAQRRNKQGRQGAQAELVTPVGCGPRGRMQRGAQEGRRLLLSTPPVTPGGHAFQRFMTWHKQLLI